MHPAEDKIYTYGNNATRYRSNRMEQLVRADHE